MGGIGLALYLNHGRGRLAGYLIFTPPQCSVQSAFTAPLFQVRVHFDGCMLHGVVCVSAGKDRPAGSYLRGDLFTREIRRRALIH